MNRYLFRISNLLLVIGYSIINFATELRCSAELCFIFVDKSACIYFMLYIQMILVKVLYMFEKMK